MEKKKIDIEDPLSVSGFIVAAVTQTVISGWNSNRQASFFGIKKPLFVYILDTERNLKSYTIEGEEVSPDLIISKYPELKIKVEEIFPRHSSRASIVR